MDSHGSAPSVRAPIGAVPQSRSADGDVTRRRQAVIQLPVAAGPVLYEWTVLSPGQWGSCGVTSDQVVATIHVVTALLHAPVGAIGHVRPAYIDRDQPLDYVASKPIVRACRLQHDRITLWGGA